MSDVPPIGRPSPAAMGRAGQPNRPPASLPESARGRDQVELSRTAQLLSKIHELPEVRQDLVARVRDQIESHRYETPEKLDAAIRNLLEEEGVM